MIPSLRQHDERSPRQEAYRPSARLWRDATDRERAKNLLESLRYKYDVQRGVIARWGRSMQILGDWGRTRAPYFLPYLILAYALAMMR